MFRFPRRGLAWEGKFAVNLGQTKDNPMKKLIFLLGLLFGLQTQAKLIIISDIDDTLKQTDVLNKLDLIQNAIVGEKPFHWMPSVFSEIQKFHQEKASISYISSSVDCITNQSKWIKKHGFPEGKVIQRTCKKGEISYQVPGKNYKILVITKTLMNLPVGQDHEIYLFGDNGQHDAEVYQYIKGAFPQLKIHAFIRDIRVEATKIHPVLSLKKLDGIQYFLTELDFFNMPEFAFMDLELKSRMIEEDQKNKLMADYLPLTLSKRFYKAGYRKLYALKLSKNLLEQYY